MKNLKDFKKNSNINLKNFMKFIQAKNNYLEKYR